MQQRALYETEKEIVNCIMTTKRNQQERFNVSVQALRKAMQGFQLRYMVNLLKDRDIPIDRTHKKKIKHFVENSSVLRKASDRYIHYGFKEPITENTLVMIE